MLLISTTIITKSQQVSMNIAQRVAVNYISAKADAKEITLNLSKVITHSQDTLFYIFNSTHSGFVIVAGDYRVEPILAFSTENSILIDSNNHALIEWLQMYENAIIDIKSNSSAHKEIRWSKILNGETGMEKIKGVAPLVSTKWNQGVGYNYYCPYFQGAPADDRCYTGCVATAMAQVMNYYNFPVKGTGSHSYYHPYYVNISANFDTTYYGWSSMTNSVNPSSKESIATLMFHCGVAVDMDYGISGSGANTALASSGLVNYFGYHPSIEYYKKSQFFSNEQWVIMLTDNLDLHRPIIYSGSGSQGGHAFVMDGYQDTNYFHINWGWGGASDGYYSLNNLLTFNSNQGAIVNIFPKNGDYCTGQRVLNYNQGIVSDQSDYSYYRQNTHCDWLIEPTNASKLQLIFNYFHTQANKDFVTVYDGTTTSSPVLGAFSGQTIPPILIANSGKMLITFTSDSAVQDQGWEAEYTAITLGLIEIPENEFKVFPNPAENYLIIESSKELSENNRIEIMNLSGKIIYENSFDSSDKSENRIDISNFATGLYLIRTSNEKEISHIQRFIKI